MRTCETIDLGLIPYTEAFDLQRRTVAARKVGAIGDVLLICEHPHVITLGRNGSKEHLLASEHVLRQKGVQFHATDRGGDITYHGPGQIVGYPILNLGAIRRDVGWYMRMVEEAMIRATRDFGLVAKREEGKTGIWVETSSAASNMSKESAKTSEPEKLGALGVHLSRWVTSHGFAYNVSTDLRYFDLIVPCGIAGRKATSLEKLLMRGISPSEVKPRLLFHFGEVFEFEMSVRLRASVLDNLLEFEKSQGVWHAAQAVSGAQADYAATTRQSERECKTV
jgi:lipoate-protein ligase B